MQDLNHDLYFVLERRTRIPAIALTKGGIMLQLCGINWGSGCCAMNQKKDRLLPILGACSAGMMLLLLFSHTYNDILVTAKHGMQFWKILFDGDILHFFELNYVASGNEYYSAVQGCAYNILLYIVFAIWNIPMALLSAFTNVDVMNNIFCIAYIKLMTVAAMAISVVILGRILRLLDVDRKNHGLLAFLYLTSSLMIAVVFVVSQYDLVSVVFQLLGFQAFLEKKDKKFVFFFGIAFCLKYFSVILFLPLLVQIHKILPIGTHGMLVEHNLRAQLVENLPGSDLMAEAVRAKHIHAVCANFSAEHIGVHRVQCAYALQQHISSGIPLGLLGGQTLAFGLVI